MSGKKLLIVVIGVLSIALVLAACTTPTPEVVTEKVVETVVVQTEKEVKVVETVIVPATPEVKEVVVTATPEPVVVPELEQTFTVAMGRDTGPLNPHGYNSQWVALSLVYEPLVVYNADGSVGPGLAESWEESADGLTWTFHLRQGVTFQDGTPFDAAAAKWNLERWIGVPDHVWIPTNYLVDAIEAPDEYTVVLHFKDYYYAAIQDLVLTRPIRFLSPNAVDAQGNFVAPVGTGPWKVEEYVPDQRTVFVPYENYWGTKPLLDKVVLEVIPDPQTRIAALLSGEVQLIGGEYIGGISLDSIPVLERNPNVKVLTAPGSTTYAIMMNYRQPPFDDVRARQALNLAIDRQAISDLLFRGLAAPAEGMFPSNVPYVTRQHPEAYAYDPEQAKALLADAGYTPGADGILEKDGQRLELTVLIDSNVFPQAKSIAEVMQAELSDVGIAADMRLLEYGAWSEALMSGDFDMATNITWGAPYDPHMTLSGMFKSGYTNLEGNFYADPALDQLIVAALGTKTEAERQAVYDQIWSYVDENAVAVPIVYSLRVYALDTRVQGFELAPTEYELDLTGVSIGAR